MKKKLLIVEDEKNLCLLYREELTKAGYKVTAVADADTALEQISKQTFDLINTAYQSYKHDFMTWAADAYIVKSASLDELKSKIKELIG